MKKKVISLFMAIALSMTSFAVPVFADEVTTNDCAEEIVELNSIDNEAIEIVDFEENITKSVHTMESAMSNDVTPGANCIKITVPYDGKITFSYTLDNQIRLFLLDSYGMKIIDNQTFSANSSKENNQKSIALSKGDYFIKIWDIDGKDIKFVCNITNTPNTIQNGEDLIFDTECTEYLPLKPCDYDSSITGENKNAANYRKLIMPYDGLLSTNSFSASDIRMFIYDKDGMGMYTNMFAGDGSADAPKIHRLFLRKGTYYIKYWICSEKNDSTHKFIYTLKTIPNTVQTGDSIPLNTECVEYLGVKYCGMDSAASNDLDDKANCRPFTVSKSGKITITSFSDSDIRAYIYDSKGSAVAQNIFIGDGSADAPSKAEVNLKSAGTYYIKLWICGARTESPKLTYTISGKGGSVKPEPEPGKLTGQIVYNITSDVTIINTNVTNIIIVDASTNTYNYNINTKVVLPTAQRKGYQFKGWFTDPECKKKVKITKKTIEDFTLYPKWAPCKYTVEYYVAKGDTKPAFKASLKLGDNKAMKLANLKKLGLTSTSELKGWATEDGLVTIADGGTQTVFETALKESIDWQMKGSKWIGTLKLYAIK